MAIAGVLWSLGSTTEPAGGASVEGVLWSLGGSFQPPVEGLEAVLWELYATAESTAMIGAVADGNPSQSDGSAAAATAPGFLAGVGDSNPEQLDAGSGVIVIPFFGAIEDATPAQLDEAGVAAAAPRFEAVGVDANPVQTDSSGSSADAPPLNVIELEVRTLIVAGTIGAPIRLILMDDGAVHNPARATQREITIVRPDRSRLVKGTADVQVSTDSRGRPCLEYLSVAGDLTLPGRYRAQGWIVDEDGEWPTESEVFRVYPSMRAGNP